MESTAFNHELDPDGESIILRLVFEEEKYPNLEDVSSMLYDLVLAHDLGTILVRSEYATFRFTRYFAVRNQRRLQPRHKLRAVAISKRSPLLLEIVGTITGVWALIQIIDKVANWSLNKKKLQLEIDKLQYEKALKQVEILEKTHQFEEQLRRRDAEDTARRIIRRLEESPLHLKGAEVRSTSDPQAAEERDV